MKNSFKVLAMVLLINILSFPILATVKPIDEMENIRCEVVHLSGTVCKISEDKNVTKLVTPKLNDLPYLQNKDSIVTVDKNSTAELQLENIKIVVKPRTRLVINKASADSENLHLMCHLLQGEISLETYRNSKKEINIMIDTKSSTIVVTEKEAFKFTVTDTGKVTVYLGAVEICTLNNWIETNFMDRMLQRELLRSVTAGESGFFRYSTQHVLKESPEQSKDNSPRAPTRAPTELPDNTSRSVLPVDNEDGKVHIEESD